MKNKPAIFRQGDVLIQRIDELPQTITPMPRENGKIILAHGEVTNHSHAIAAKKAHQYADGTGVTYLDIQAALANLTHEEHATIPLARGFYRVIRQREYSPEAIRNVAD
jgi:hypothetical protein